jgi:hypothetical protein
MDDLKITEAKAITARIRKWVKAIPIDDVQRAYEGRVWIVMGHGSWAQWCEVELNGFKLPVPQRRKVVDELDKRGMSQRSIAEVVGAARSTVQEDLKSTGRNRPLDQKITGQDGRKRNPPKPKYAEPEPVYQEPEPEPTPLTNVLDAAMDSAEIQDEAVAIRNQSRCLRTRMEELTAKHHYSGDPYTIECLNEASDNCIATSTEIMQFTIAQESSCKN